MRKINLHNIGHGILYRGVESLMGGKKRQNYIQTSQNRLLYVIIGVVACLVVAGVVGYMKVTSHRVEREVVRPVQQEIPSKLAARGPTQAEEPEGQPAVSPPSGEVTGLPSPEEEQPETGVGVAAPPEEPTEVDTLAVLEEEVVVGGTETAEAPTIEVEEEVQVELVVEPAEGPAAPSVVEEEVSPVSDVGEEETVLPTAAVEDMIKEGEAEEEPAAARAEAPAGTVEAPEETSVEVEEPVSVAAIETPAPPAVTPVEPAELMYGLHVVSYQSEEEAIKDVMARLRQGQQALAVPTKIPEKGLWYRVLVGRYPSLEEASEQGARLKEEGYDYAAPAALPYLIEVSTFQTLTVAGFEEGKLRNRGYTTFIVPVVEEKDESLRYKVCGGAFDGPEEAKIASERLREEGIANIIIRP